MPNRERSYEDTLYALRNMRKSELLQFALTIVADESVSYESIQSAIDTAEAYAREQANSGR